ncbi:MAG TPA: hypothetical protein PK530_18515 [Anaerolineales bacterium]|nr:hypothetical protein [Anaerolineales bacterium]
MKLSITSPSEDELVIYRRPNYAMFLLWMATGVVIVWWSLNEKSAFAFTAFIVVIAAVIELFTQYEITCKINKGTQKVEYQRKDILGDYLGFQVLQVPISDIQQIEMRRHPSRRRDTFQICFAVNPTENLPLTGKDLSFSECQNYAGTIGQFLGPEIPVVAVD